VANGDSAAVSSAPSEPRDDPFRGIWLRLLSLGLRPATAVPVALLIGACIPLSLVTSGPSFCPFKLMTGLPCPGCGMTRSVVALLHGDVPASAFFHPLGVPFVLAMLALAVADAFSWWRGCRAGQSSRPASWLLERVMTTPAPWVAIGALTVVWLVRLPLYVLGTWTF
jgi:hypothetical protein